MKMARTLNDLLRQERKWIGTKEHPDGSNRTRLGERFGWNGVKWCAITQVVCLRDAGFHEVPKNASAWGLGAKLCTLKGWRKVSATDIRAGDIVVFQFSHIGFCEARKSRTVKRTIEGNVGNAVKRLIRSSSSIKYGVRPPFASENQQAPKHSPNEPGCTWVDWLVPDARLPEVDAWCKKYGQFIAVRQADNRSAIVSIHVADFRLPMLLPYLESIAKGQGKQYDALYDHTIRKHNDPKRPYLN
jgi:hypothetical protein